jgi:hypothetical protein
MKRHWQITFFKKSTLWEWSEDCQKLYNSWRWCAALTKLVSLSLYRSLGFPLLAANLLNAAKKASAVKLVTSSRWISLGCKTHKDCNVYLDDSLATRRAQSDTCCYGIVNSCPLKWSGRLNTEGWYSPMSCCCLEPMTNNTCEMQDFCRRDDMTCWGGECESRICIKG